ncbi:TRAPPC5/Trs31 [Spironucleus salmonicida]|uniref:TRAPPC5/Trs31 n=1 Tax=Spironucleus salmonicida TaxID=348837 RepID=A0A9P8LW54_9EUKA|nr:TRAPPC5/Trs31 [Spironucleus salmonicida]
MRPFSRPLAAYDQRLRSRQPTQPCRPLFGYLLCEYFAHVQQRHRGLPADEYITACEQRLQALGVEAGARLWEQFCLRRLESTDRGVRAPLDLGSAQDVLNAVRAPFWAFLFGEDERRDVQLLRLKDNNGFYLIEREPATDQYISFPRDYSGIQPSAVLSGVIRAVLGCCGFESAVKVFLSEGLTYYEVVLHE